MSNATRARAAKRIRRVCFWVFIGVLLAGSCFALNPFLKFLNCWNARQTVHKRLSRGPEHRPTE